MRLFYVGHSVLNGEHGQVVVKKLGEGVLAILCAIFPNASEVLCSHYQLWFWLSFSSGFLSKRFSNVTTLVLNNKLRPFISMVNNLQVNVLNFRVKMFVTIGFLSMFAEEQCEITSSYLHCLAGRQYTCPYFWTGIDQTLSYYCNQSSIF